MLPWEHLFLAANQTSMVMSVRNVLKGITTSPPVDALHVSVMKMAACTPIAHRIMKEAVIARYEN